MFHGGDTHGEFLVCVTLLMESLSGRLVCLGCDRCFKVRSMVATVFFFPSLI